MLDPKARALPAGRMIVRALQAENVRIIFGIVGSHVIEVYDALHDAPQIRPITAKHEVGAAFMAASYARAAGAVGVCITTAGPGVLNALNGLGQARFSGAPMVLIAGGVPLAARPYELHGLAEEQYTLQAAGAIAKYAVRVRSCDELVDALAEAFSACRSSRPGPAYVEVPWNLFGADAPDNVRDYTPLPVRPARFDRSRCEAAGAALADKARVALVLDKMLMGSRHASALLELARRRNWALCTTRDAMNLAPVDHDAFGGVVHDHHFGRYGFERLAQSEACVAIGFDRGGENLSFVRGAAGGEVTELCSVHESSDRDDGCTLDEALDAFLRGCESAEGAAQGSWSALVRPRDGHRRVLEEVEQHAGDAPVHFGYALSRLHLQLDDSPATIVHDTGSHEVWARCVLPPTATLRTLGGGNWGSMGHAIPAAAGARAALPDERIVCVTGDGCLLMSLMDLPTLIELGGPTLILNLNDAEYGMITKVQHKAHGRSYATALPRADYAQIARQFGARAARIDDPRALDAALAEALASREPWFIDVIARSEPRYPKL